MKLKLLIIPALLMATSLFAQGPGGFGGRRGLGASGNSGTPPTPPTAAQLATRELQMAAAFLGLDAAQTSTLVGNAALVTDLTTEQTTLQANREALRTDYATLGTSIASTPATLPSATVTDINNLNAASLQARVTAAGQMVTAIESLALTSTQQGKVPNLVDMLVNGTPGGFRGPHFQ